MQVEPATSWAESAPSAAFLSATANSTSGSCTWGSQYGGNTARTAVARLYFWLSLIFALLSMTGSVTIITLYWRLKDLRSAGRRLLVYLSLADFLTAVGNLIGLNWFAVIVTPNLDSEKQFTNYTVCQMQAAWSTFSSISSFSWSVVIAVNVFMTAKYGSDFLTRRLAIPCHIFCWGLGVLTVAITASEGQFGYDRCTIYWCWIRRDYEFRNQPSPWRTMLLWQLVTGKAYEVLTVVITIVLFWLSWRQIRRQSRLAADRLHANRDSTTMYKYASRKLLFVPFVFILSRIFGILRFAMNVNNGGTGQNLGDSPWWIASEYMAPLQGMGDSSQGLLNCLVFVFTTRAVRELLRRKMPSWMLPRNPSATQLSTERSALITDSRHEHVAPTYT